MGPCVLFAPFPFRLPTHVYIYLFVSFLFVCVTKISRVPNEAVKKKF